MINGCGSGVLDGNASENTGATDYIIRLSSSTPTRCVISNLKIQNAPRSGVDCEGGRGCVFDTCEFTGCGYLAIRLHGGSGNRVSKCRFYDLPGTLFSAIFIDETSSVIDSCEFLGIYGSAAITFAANGAKPVCGNVVSNNTFRINHTAIHFNTDNEYATGNIIIGNTIWGTGDPKPSYGMLRTHRSIITGNVIYNYSTGIHDGNGLSISNNTIIACSNGIYSNTMSDTSIAENTFVNCATGLKIANTGSNGIAIGDNRYVANSTNKTITGGLVFIHNIYGKTASDIPDGGTIPHGCFFTPSSATATGSVAGEIVTVTSIDATNITVAIKKPDGSAGTVQTIYWRAEV